MASSAFNLSGGKKREYISVYWWGHPTGATSIGTALFGADRSVKSSVALHGAELVGEIVSVSSSKTEEITSQYQRTIYITALKNCKITEMVTRLEDVESTSQFTLSAGETLQRSQSFDDGDGYNIQHITTYVIE